MQPIIADWRVNPDTTRQLGEMRTTLTLDDDVLASARALAAQRGVPLGTIVSELVRRGLDSAPPSDNRNGIRLFPVQPGARSKRC
jgi:hypothetical protein